MKKLLTLMLLIAAKPAQAHVSLVPHHHPHGASMLPDLDTFVVGAILAIAVAFLVFAKFRRG
jgi:hypothetical protein